MGATIEVPVTAGYYVWLVECVPQSAMLPRMTEPDYRHNTDTELLERLRSAIETMHSSLDHEERRRTWQQEARPLANELERRFPPLVTPLS